MPSSKIRGTALLLTGFWLGTHAVAHASVAWWLTTADKSSLLTPQTSVSFARSESRDITVDSSRHYQTIDGFGFALTGGSADHIIDLPAEKRRALLEELFSPRGAGIGINYLRLSIGSSDLNAHTFSYDDMPEGQTDENLANFSLNEDLTNVVPVLKEILTIAPKIHILASPWSAPLWMKTNHNIQGGKLQEKYYDAYARYFAHYIRAMAAEGITIDAITIQNEPFNDGNTPSMQMFAKEQARFVRDHLGPLFEREGIHTKIVLYDHNCDAPEYPISVLTDADARRYVNGSGFHLYAGPIEAMSEVHNRFPDKALYFTEMMAVDRKGFHIAVPVARILIGATRNWSRNVILWNLAANAAFEPHTDNGGCRMCQGAITIEQQTVERNLAYFVIGHASKFVPPGSTRIDSTSSINLPNVAFLTPSGDIVLIAANATDAMQKFSFGVGENAASVELTANAVATFVWHP